MSLLSPPVGFDRIAEDYAIAGVANAIYNDLAELVRINVHIYSLRIRSQ
jgi:hypothetical protein